MTKNRKNQMARAESNSSAALNDCDQMIWAAKTNDTSVTAPVISTTMDVRFDTYSLAPFCPSRFLTETYTGRNAVTNMPAVTSS